MSISKRIDPALWVILVYFITFLAIFKMAPTIMGAIAFGWYLSLIIEVPAKFLSKIKGVSFRFGTIVSAIGMFSLFAYAFYQIFPIVIDEGKKIFPMLQTAAKELNLGALFQSQNVDQKAIDLVENFTGEMVTRFSQTGVSVLNFILQRIPQAITATMIFLITASYFTSLTPLLKKNIWRFFPKSTYNQSLNFLSVFYKDVRHFIGGQVILALLIGCLVGFGMFVSGIPYPLFLGFLSGITNFVPYLGVFVAAIPALLLGFTNGSIEGVIRVVIVLVIVNQLESWLLSPKIQGSRMKINWFAIILSMFLCGAYFGIVGVLLAIPMIVFFRHFWIEYVQEFFKQL